MSDCSAWAATHDRAHVAPRGNTPVSHTQCTQHTATLKRGRSRGRAQLVRSVRMHALCAVYVRAPYMCVQPRFKAAFVDVGVLHLLPALAWEDEAQPREARRALEPVQEQRRRQLLGEARDVFLKVRILAWAQRLAGLEPSPRKAVHDRPRLAFPRGRLVKQPSNQHEEDLCACVCAGEPCPGVIRR
jgi:hypothetical protein